LALDPRFQVLYLLLLVPQLFLLETETLNLRLQLDVILFQGCHCLFQHILLI
jgi:hypothetical protein